MNVRTWTSVSVAGVAVIALLAWAFAPRPLEVETAVVTQGPFEATIDEDAKTRLRDRYIVSAPLTGHLSRIALREGDAVAAMAVVATLTPVLSPLLDERTARELGVRVDIARARQQQAHSRIELAKVGLLQANSEVLRSDELARQGFVSRTKLEADRLAALAAQRELDAAVDEGHVAAHEVEQARVALLAVRGTDRSAALGFPLRAPVAGRVLRVAQTSETVVSLGTPLVEIGNPSDLEIVAELLTTDALRTAPGSRVVIERWGGAAVLEGRVRRIEPAAFTKVSALGVEEQRVRVLIDIVSPGELWRALGDAYRVAVRIVTVSEAAAIQLPVSALFPVPAHDDGSAEPARMAVFVVDGARVRLQTVEVAARNSTHAWLRQGVAAGATVVVYPPAPLTDGARVHRRAV